MKNRMLIFFSALTIFFSHGCNEPTFVPPNVVMIVVDDMNGYGVLDQFDYVKTPYLDAFRDEAVNFVNAACNAPVCTPSRSSFFSGMAPQRSGSYLNGNGGWDLDESPLKTIESLPECFKRNGYETWGRGKIFHYPLDPGREDSMFNNRPIYKGGFGPFPEEEYWVGGTRFRSIKAWEGPDMDFPDVKNADAAIQFLSEDHDKPFFLYYGLWRPHSPYTAPARFFEMYENDSFKLPESILDSDLDDVPVLGRMLVDSLKNYLFTGHEKDQEKLVEFIKAYAANYSFADWNVGRVIDALDKSKYAENTLVIFFSDNGFHTGQKLRWGKATLWEQADYVPLMVRKPGGARGTSIRTVSLVDIYPTLVEYCRLEGPEHSLDGHSMVHLFDDPNGEWEYPSFTCYGENYSSVRDERYRFLEYPDGTRELYDHKTDPYEFNNIIEDSAYAAEVERLEKHIPGNWATSIGGRLEVPRKNQDLSSLK